MSSATAAAWAQADEPWQRAKRARLDRKAQANADSRRILEEEQRRDAAWRQAVLQVCDARIYGLMPRLAHDGLLDPACQHGWLVPDTCPVLACEIIVYNIVVLDMLIGTCRVHPAGPWQPRLSCCTPQAAVHQHCFCHLPRHLWL